MGKWIDRLALAALFGGIMGLIAGFFGWLHPAFDTFAHFRWHAGLALVAMTAYFALRGHRLAIATSAAAAILAIAGSLAGMPPRSMIERAQAGTETHSLLHYNLRFDNPEHDAVISLIRRTDADILSLSETSTEWREALSGLSAIYPYRFHCPEWFVYGGGMILSKFPLSTEDRYCHDYAALALTEAMIDGRQIVIGSAHLRWPWPASGPRQVEALKPQLARLGENTLIAGDFNATTWSHTVRAMAAAGRLDILPGLGGTWMYKLFPSWLAPWFGLPIDGALYGSEINILSAETLESFGSDHLPVLIHFEIDDAGEPLSASLEANPGD